MLQMFVPRKPLFDKFSFVFQHVFPSMLNFFLRLFVMILSIIAFTATLTDDPPKTFNLCACNKKKKLQ